MESVNLIHDYLDVFSGKKKNLLPSTDSKIVIKQVNGEPVECVTEGDGCGVLGNYV